MVEIEPEPEEISYPILPRNNRWVSVNPDHSISISHLSCADGDPREELLLCKTLFELSRDGLDTFTHWDSERDTLESLGVGSVGHRPITAERIDVADVPSDRSKRDQWRFVSSRIVPQIS